MAHLGFFESIARDLGGKGMFGGNFQLRLILQPLAALILGVRYGLRDARTGRAPFVAAMANDKVNRAAYFQRSLRDAIVPISVAVVIDFILQYLNNHQIRPLGAIVVAALLVYVPFVIIRGITNRVWSRSHGRGQVPHAP